jgi:hypothetical protein
MEIMTKGRNEKGDWSLIEEFVNALTEKGSTDNTKNTLQWFIPLMNDTFSPAEGWSPYKRQTLKTSTVYLRQCESDPLKKDRVNYLKGLLCDKIQKFSNEPIEQNDKVTFHLDCISPLKWGKPY